jgi:membrane protease YdiL (CAAX protease family)
MLKSPALPLIAPLFLFMVFLSLQGFVPDQHYVLYPVVTVLVATVLMWFWSRLPSLAPSAPLLSIAVGVAGIILWVGLDPWAMQLNVFLENAYNHAIASVGLPSWSTPVDPLHPIGRNPFLLYRPLYAWILFGFRLAGIALCVPIMEELFWRAFLMRWLIREDFTSVPMGTYQPFSFWITTACFAAVHGPEWPLGAIVGILYGAWFVRTKNLGNIVLAHGVTNLLLALYCLFTNEWHFLSTVAAPAPTKP